MPSQALHEFGGYNDDVITPVATWMADNPRPLLAQFCTLGVVGGVVILPSMSHLV
jgi:hypothetical protein